MRSDNVCLVRSGGSRVGSYRRLYVRVDHIVFRSVRPKEKGHWRIDRWRIPRQLGPILALDDIWEAQALLGHEWSKAAKLAKLAVVLVRLG